MSTPIVQVCLSLGSNIAPQKFLPRAVDRLRDFLEVEAVSRAWRTPPVGAPGPDFLNAALLACTSLSPFALKIDVLRRVEAQLGRVRVANKFAPRTIDIDIVVYGNQVLEPLLWTQAYLALPVAELLPGLFNPLSGETLEQIAARLAAQTNIEPSPEVLESE
jgi:2-amino-4-hydroxy-6-hydroxymethyldihydropteridine diphosphokinase